MKLVSGRPLGEPAPPKLLELANAVEPVQDWSHLYRAD
jgi:hypothetical protein